MGGTGAQHCSRLGLTEFLESSGTAAAVGSSVTGQVGLYLICSCMEPPKAERDTKSRVGCSLLEEPKHVQSAVQSCQDFCLG